MKIQRSNFGKDKVFGYWMHEEKYNFHLHAHQFVELVLILDGELCVTVGESETERAMAGDFILIFPFQPHKYSSDRVSKFAMYTFSPNFIADFIESVNGKVGARSVFSADDSTYRLFISRLIGDGAEFSFYGIRACLYAMLADFCKRVPLSEKVQDNNVLEKMLRYMNENYTAEISLAKVAKEIGYSSNYLSHCIKKSFSFGYPTLLACIRVEHAKKLIVETKRTSLEIALECGFGSERSFNRQFKLITGVTPRGYKISGNLTVVNKELSFMQDKSDDPVFSVPQRKSKISENIEEG